MVLLWQVYVFDPFRFFYVAIVVDTFGYILQFFYSYFDCLHYLTLQIINTIISNKTIIEGMPIANPIPMVFMLA